MKSILNPDFKYVRSDDTTPDHLRQVFERERRRIEAERRVKASESRVWPFVSHMRKEAK